MLSTIDWYNDVTKNVIEQYKVEVTIPKNRVTATEQETAGLMLVTGLLMWIMRIVFKIYEASPAHCMGVSSSVTERYSRWLHKLLGTNYYKGEPDKL